MLSPRSPRRSRSEAKPSGCSTTRTLTYVTAAAIILWCLVTPTLLLNHLQEDLPTHPRAAFVQTNLGALSVVDKGRSSGPAIIRMENSLWRLEDATPEELAHRDWYERGRLLVNKNLYYLSQSEERATRADSNITLVSGMFDLGRGDLPDAFKRSFDHYVERFSNFLLYKFPKILFIQPEHYHFYQPYLDQVREYPVHVINTTLDDIRAFKYYQEVQAMREKPGWATRAGWLADSPQAKMALYNPMVMSKLLWTRDAAQLNPFNTDGFLWIDGGHLCNDPRQLTQQKTDVFKDHFDKLLITYFDYQPAGEIHGFEEKPFRRYIDSQERIIRVGRGGVFGGTREYLEVASEVYMEVLGETLQAGYMGTEENIFSILHYRFPELVADYENGEGGNCAIFSEAIYGPPPPPMEELVVTQGFDLRGLTCTADAQGRITCLDGDVRCPSYVTPMWLSKADGQYVCNLKGHYCTARCLADGSVAWTGHTCPVQGEACAPPHGRTAYTTFYENPVKDEHAGHSHEVLLPPSGQVAGGSYFVGKMRINEWNYAKTARERPPTKREIAFTDHRKSKLVAKAKEIIVREGFNLRGLECEIKDGKEVCFLNHQLGRDMCPPDVSSTSLTIAQGQPSCQQGGQSNYCVAICQDGTDILRWSAYNTDWCLENPDFCSPRPQTVPYDDFVLREWSEPHAEPKTCESKPVSEFEGMAPFTVTVLCRGTELGSLRYALETWTKGFMQFADEWIFFVNDWSDDMAELLTPYTKAPYNAKIRSSDINHGILQPIKWLIGNATNEHVLFLEKDFRLVESLPCALEQLSTGLDMLKGGTADVVKFRSRYNGGKANWADILYRGKEETVFERQPNLLCNFYHWVDNPEEVWPEHFHVCNEDPLMYCVDAEFCNWTNNPFFISKYWWIDNYEKKHWEIRTPPADFDLETWMNWDPEAWNHRGWTIAEGDGMFKHADIFKFGV